MAKKEKKGKGRPPKVEINDELLSRVREMASVGLTNYQIAHNLGIHVATWCEYKLKHPEINEAISAGASEGIQQVCNALFQNATEKMNVSAQVFFLKNRAGWQDNPDIKSDAPPPAEVDVEWIRAQLVDIAQNGNAQAKRSALDQLAKLGGHYEKDNIQKGAQVAITMSY